MVIRTLGFSLPRSPCRWSSIHGVTFRSLSLWRLWVLLLAKFTKFSFLKPHLTFHSQARSLLAPPLTCCLGLSWESLCLCFHVLSCVDGLPECPWARGQGPLRGAWLPTPVWGSFLPTVTVLHGHKRRPCDGGVPSPEGVPFPGPPSSRTSGYLEDSRCKLKT